MRTAAKKPKKGAIARSDKMRGLYQRRKIFWYTQMIKWARTQMSLDAYRYEDASASPAVM
jgi:hypothetical protein